MGSDVVYSRLRLVWEMVTRPVNGQVRVWGVQIERYEITDDCCPNPYECSRCPDDHKVKNSHFITSPVSVNNIQSTCAWECDTHYEDVLRNGECNWCQQPNCSIGQYFQDCGLCAACSQIPTNAFWVAPGDVRGDNTSCEFECNQDFFQSPDQSSINVCIPCSNYTCSQHEYRIPCSKNVDASCAMCTTCSRGFFETFPCNSSHDRICDECKIELPSGAFWMSACTWECNLPLLKNPVLSTCTRCEQLCVVGNYSTGACDATNNYTGCLPCALPTAAIPLSAGVGFNNTCAWRCPTTHYYDVWSMSCFAMALIPTTTPVPAVVCTNHTECSLLWGQYQGVDSCQCIPCEKMRGNHTQIAVSAWEQPGACAWFCLHPFMRQDDLCFTVRELAMRPTTLTPAAIPNAARGKAPTFTIFFASMVPMLLLLVAVAFKMAI
ncbi:hypothetical protein T484DRAFT_1758457 [Baffinella frigidus]|nr:hypothetical protein T484DRAFT_1758457 [Cryptophyta sp. CCMP2293]